MRKYIFFFLVLIGIPSVSLGATEPFLFLTWNARSYVPDSYLGKIIPGPNSPIIVSLEAIQDGKIADLRSSTIKWYVDGELFSSVVGQKSFTIRAPKRLTSGIMSIRAEVVDKWDRIKMKTVDIPLSPPLVVLKSNYLSRSFGENKISVSASPYFFGTTNLSDLIFSWKVNGQSVGSAENPQVLDIEFNRDAEPGSSISVEAFVSNPNGVQESASKRESFKYIP